MHQAWHLPSLQSRDCLHPCVMQLRSSWPIAARQMSRMPISSARALIQDMESTARLFVQACKILQACAEVGHGKGWVQPKLVSTFAGVALPLPCGPFCSVLSRLWEQEEEVRRQNERKAPQRLSRPLLAPCYTGRMRPRLRRLSSRCLKMAPTRKDERRKKGRKPLLVLQCLSCEGHPLRQN